MHILISIAIILLVISIIRIIFTQPKDIGDFFYQLFYLDLLGNLLEWLLDNVDLTIDNDD